MPAGSLQELVDVLCGRFPEDAEDLREALDVLHKQRITTCERLARLGDGQWQRLALPLGIEALLRDEAAAVLAVALEPPAAAAALAPPPAGGHEAPGVRGPRRAAEVREVRADEEEDDDCDDGDGVTAAHGYPGEELDDGSLPLEDTIRQMTRAAAARHPEDRRLRDEEDFRTTGLHRRGVGGQRTRAERPASGSLSSTRRLPTSDPGGSGWQPPEDLEALWQKLLEDALPPDKRKALQETWDSTSSMHDRYMMLLEYTSYLRKTEVTEDEKAERRKQLEPLLREFGLKNSDFEDTLDHSNGFLWWIFFGILFFIAGLIYYTHSNPDPLHDLQAF